MNSEGVLKALFSFVGKGHFLYVAGVSRSWRRHYTPKTTDDSGNPITTWHDALASVATLEHAYANGLGFYDGFRPTKDYFGPGVYEWARRHGYPLYVWVAVETQREYDSVETLVVGVFSSVRKAKGKVLSRLPDFTEEDWKRLKSGDFELFISGNHYVSLRSFAVKGLPFTDEIEPLPLYLTSTRHYPRPKDIDGVFPTRELAEKSVQEMVAQYEGLHFSHDIHLECYLDGQGGEPGEFFKTGKRKRELFQGVSTRSIDW